MPLVDAAGERVGAGLAEALLEARGDVGLVVERLDLDPRVGDHPLVVGTDDRGDVAVQVLLDRAASVSLLGRHAIGRSASVGPASVTRARSSGAEFRAATIAADAASRSRASPGCRPSSPTTGGSSAALAGRGVEAAPSPGTTPDADWAASGGGDPLDLGLRAAPRRVRRLGASRSATASTTRAALRALEQRQALPRRARRGRPAGGRDALTSGPASRCPSSMARWWSSRRSRPAGATPGASAPRPHEAARAADRGDPGERADRDGAAVSTPASTAPARPRSSSRRRASHVLRKRAVLRPDEVAPVRDDALGAAEVMYDPGLVLAGEAERRTSSSSRARWSPRSPRASATAALRPRRHAPGRRRRARAARARGGRAELSTSTRSTATTDAGRRRRSSRRLLSAGQPAAIAGSTAAAIRSAGAGYV